MSCPLSLNLALRFYRSKRKAALAKFMSFAATAGIVVGVFALIVGLSAMNGFERELNNRVLNLIPAAQIKATHVSFTDATGFAQRLRQEPGVVAALPCLELEVVFSNGRDLAPGLIYGVDSKAQLQLTPISPFLSVPLSTLDTTAPTSLATSDTPAALPVILGRGLMDKLHLEVGAICYLYVSTGARADTSATFKAPQSVALRIVGVLHSGGQLDNAVGFVALDKALTRFNLAGPNQIQLKVTDLMQAQSIAYQAAAATAQEACFVESWLFSQGKLYHDIQMVRGLMYLAMILVLAVASFNIVSTLVMVVSEKKREIAILLTMGSPRPLIVRTFCLLGLLSAIKGLTVGLILGLAVAWGLTPLTRFIETQFNFKFLNPEIYFIDFIPSSLQLGDVLLVMGCALLMSVLAALYPAWRAAKVQPALELNG